MGKEAEFRALISKSDKYDPDDISMMRELLPQVRTLSTDDRDQVSLRLTVELIDAITRFDAVSSRLIRTTNRLTIVILVVTAFGVLLAWLTK
jgi:hypothetical protein